MIKTIAIDEEGYFLLQDGIRLNDDPTGHQMLESISMDEFGVCHLNYQNQQIVVESFDKPFVVKQVHIESGKIKLQMPYIFFTEADPKSFCVDQWDRFHGMTSKGIPFVFSRAAQAELFNLADQFDDDGIVIADQRIDTPEYYQVTDQVDFELFWTTKYSDNPMPPWNLDKPHPELKSSLQQLKIHKCRILILGCGYGHDAKLLADQGHIVTAIDISENAITEAKKLYGDTDNLTFMLADALNLDESHKHQYDVIFEHTFYCAISPMTRDKLIKRWRYHLTETGFVLGIFFVVPKRTGPYFGGSEWELREKLQKDFRFLYWTRLKHSPGWRKGAELLVYAQVQEKS